MTSPDSPLPPGRSAADDDADNGLSGAAPPGPTQDEGPGWMPAILAGGLLILMAVFICCGISTAYLWNQRGELAARTLRGHTIAMIEQSQLAPQEKQAINALLTEVADQIDAGELEDWQAAAIMQRLQRLPLNEWGDLAAIEALVRARDDWTDAERATAFQQLSRLRRAVAVGQATQLDLYDVLEPVRRESPQSPSGTKIIENPSRRQIGEVVNRAQLVSDRLEIEDRLFSDVSLATLVRQQIEAGRDSGEI